MLINIKFKQFLTPSISISISANIRAKNRLSLVINKHKRFFLL